ncbi:hypothetical protein FRC01_003334 [Tulasnella sp. 417]|nr:hypothetical protein FRC01_003334 [Tulasnella sp. 417]
MLPSTSTTHHVVFDGATESSSFLDFVRRLERSPDLVQLTSSEAAKNIEHVVPAYLYGEALRHYESLDQDCQDDWARLQDAMAGRFPGAVRSGGVVRRSTTQWDEDGLRTLVDAPPLTPSKLAAPNAEPEEELVRDASRHKHIEDGTKWKPKRIVTKVKVDLNDPQAVRSAAKIPLLRINCIGADRLVQPKNGINFHAEVDPFDALQDIGRGICSQSIAKLVASSSVTKF